MTQRTKIIIAIVSVLAVITIIVGLAVSSNQQPKTGVQFVAVPDDIAMTSGDKKAVVDYESIVAFNPGTHEITLKREHFETTTITADVKENELTLLYVAMKPTDAQGESTLRTSTMRSRLERIAGFEVRTGAEELSKNYSFIDKLPITGKYYTINPCALDASSEDEYGICIDMPIDKPFYRTQALEALADAGITASEWVIVYNNSLQRD